MICKNCEQSFEGHFCNNCGQNSKVQKISFRFLVEDILNSALQVNRGILFTIKELTIRPGHSIRDFLEGKRKHHFKPIAFVLLLSTIYVLFTYLTGTKTYLISLIEGMINSLSKNGYPATVLKSLGKNHAYLTLVLLPIFSFASYLSFIKAKYNYFEHLIINLYIAGQQMVIYLIFAIMYHSINSESYYLQIIPFILSFLFTFWTFIQFFQSKKMIAKIFLSLLTYFIYIILFTVLIFMVSVIENN